MSDHKDPKDRAHLWQRPERADEAAAAPASFDYHLELPRHVHAAGGESKIVFTPDEAEDALANGFYLHPNDIPAAEEALDVDEAAEEGDEAEGDDAPEAPKVRKQRKARKAKAD